MVVVEQRTYVGPNQYARFPVIRLTLDLGALEHHPSGALPGFVDGLLAWMPTLREHGCSYGEPGGFVRRLTEDGGTWMGHVMEHVAIEMQNLAGNRVTFGKTRGTGVVGQYHVVYEYEDAWIGQQVATLALETLHALVPKDLVGAGDTADFDFKAEMEGFLRGAERRAFGPSTLSLVRAAAERDIPWIRLNDASLVQFGHGRHQRRIQATVTSETRHIAVEIASDKELTNKLLGEIGLPVPKQTSVFREDEAARAARRIGYPVVVKPLDANHGRGVSIGLTTEEQVRTAYTSAREHARTVLVEQMIVGLDHRLLVVDGSLVAASKRVPGHVVGDGVHTIGELVDIINSDPRRGVGHEKTLTRLEMDAQALRLLADAGHTPASVLAVGDVFFLRTTGNLSTGGTAIDVTDVIHPDNRDMAVRAASAVGLDVCGVDFLSPDITRSYKDVGGGICEVNAAPGFRMHVAPSEGTPRDVAGAVLDMLFPPGRPSRIPIATISGTNGKTTTTRMLAHIHKLVGRTVGMTTTDGVYVDGQRTVEGDMTGPVAAHMVLKDPTVDCAILEVARGGLLRAGLGFRHPDVSCCLNVSEDHLGNRGVDTLDQLAEIKRIPIEVARDTVVLNADDHRCNQMAEHSVAKHICYVTTSPSNMLVREHVRAGGRAVALEAGVNGQMITLYDKGAHIPLLWTHLIPATLEGRAAHNVVNAMFAAGMAYAMGVKLDDIRHGLRTFDTTFFQAPGRMNVYDNHGFKVILDYGHNPAAVSAMCDLVDRLSEGAVGARRVVLAAPGDRRDVDIDAIGRRAARTFDHFILREDDDRRGRPPGDVPRRLAAALAAEGVSADRITVIPSEVEALQHALSTASQRDVVLIFGDKVSRCWKQIIYFGGKREEAPVAPTPVVVEVEATAEGGQRFIRDHRGVRLAVDTED